MILEYIIDFRSNTQIYEKIFVKLLKKYSLDGKIIRDDFISKLYVKIENTKNFEEFSEEFSQKLPHSIFLYDTQVKVIENMPQGNTKIDLNKKIPLPFCLDCLSCVMDKNSKHYYDIFTECEVCGYNIAGEHKNYMNDFKKIAHFIKDGNYIKLNTFYGVFVVGQLSQDCDFDFDIIAYDYATLSNYTYAKNYELKALASIEKPFIRLRTNLAFKTKIADIKQELIRFKLADDFILHLLMNELHLLGIDMIFITKSNIKYEQHICLVEPKEIEPIQIVASPTHIALTKGKRGVIKPTDNFALSDDIQACSVVIKEHNLGKKYDIISGIYLDKNKQNNILIFGEKFGVVNYLSLEFELNSIQEIFNRIISSSKTGATLISNYKNKFPNLYKKIADIQFDTLNMYQLWGVLAIILDFTPTQNIQEASKILEENALLFLGERGPRIDYKLIKTNNVTSIDALMIIRSAISYKLADIDNLSLSFGIVESFAEFISTQMDSLKENMNTKAVVATGSMLENNALFATLATNISINHDIYFNNHSLINSL